MDTEIEQLREAGVEVLPYLRSSDEIAEMSLPGKLALAGSPLYGRGAQQDLARLIESEHPDVVHLHNPYPFLSPMVVRTAQRRGVPVVQTVHNFRHVCVNGLYFRDGGLCHDCRGKTVGLPGVKHSCYRGSKAQSAVMVATLAVHRPTWKRVDRYIALTENIAEHLRDSGIEPQTITVKPNSIPDPGPHSQRGDGFVFVGRLSKEKGIDLLLEAWRTHPESNLGTLSVIGDGPMRPLVEAAAAERADIEMVGPVPHAEITRRLREASALVTTSVCEDVLPTVVIEALANARPVLTTDLGGPPSMIGEAGMVATATPAALAAVLPEMRRRAPDLSTAARERYLVHFAPDVVVQRQLEIYGQLAS